MKIRGSKAALAAGLLVALSVATAGTSSASGSSVVQAKQKPLVVSPVYLNDLSMCVDDGLLAENGPPCTGYAVADYRTSWVFNVKNPNKSMTAVSVKARLKLVDANGNDVINKVVTVAPSIFPGRTVWVAPMVTGNSSHPWTWELSDTSGKAVSGTATVLKVKWAKKKSARTPTVDADFSTTASKSCVRTTCRDYNQTASLRYRDLNFSGIIPNPSKAYNAYITRVFFADDGTPLAGYRTWETINKGANPRAYVTALPTTLASRVGGVTYFVSR